MSKVFTPIQLGPLTLVNRLAYAPMDTHFGTADGYLGPGQIEYYQERAKGGVGFITVEVNFINDRAKVWQAHEGGVLDIGDDSHIEDLARLRDAIAAVNQDVKVAVQISHVGKYGAGIRQVPSAINPPLYDPGMLLEEMSIADIEAVMDDYVKAAERVKKAGFDAVTLHGAHGLLIQQFMSPYTNQRTDAYGQDRLLFPKQLIERTRQVISKDMALIMRISADEFLEEVGITDGYTIEDMKKMAPELVATGLDAIDVSAATVDTFFWTTSPGYFKKGAFMHMAKAIKAVVDVPVMGVGRINTGPFAEKMINEKFCDIICLGRALLADPYFAGKLEQGRPQDIRCCIACNTCIATAFQKIKVYCAVNPALGREGEYTLRPKVQSRRKKVMVVGGGPGGMEAATALCLRGHEVHLFEQQDELGGQLRSACIPPGKKELRLLIGYQSRQMEKAGVDVHLKTEVDANLIASVAPDVMVLAAGSVPWRPAIEGIHGPNVVTAEDVLLGKATVGDRVAVIGGELVGCEVAHYLAEQKKAAIYVMRRHEQMATKIEPLTRFVLLRSLQAQGVQLMPCVAYDKITENGVHITDTKTCKEAFVEADTIVVATGSVPNAKIIEMAQGKTKEQLYIIGDNLEPRTIKAAIHEGAHVGRQI
ncbi:MAG: FAD-dependent oxidoreductase [Desulfatitalea sp.]|nr:FAD-dependent oxidoreductase [Desulfatitalea sp.]NNK02177.1 FAD-dependent oxidoreductase [Desulfatitalea sp.]